MAAASTRGLLVVATVLNGCLAGATIDRGVVGYFAWRELGTNAWVAYSRHADLSLRGEILYPALAIGGALCCIGAAISHYRDRRDGGAALPIFAGAVLAIAGLLLTLKAAPFMLSLAQLGDDAQAAEQAFDGFYFWSLLRGACQVLAFVANVWALAALGRAATR